MCVLRHITICGTKYACKLGVTKWLMRLACSLWDQRFTVSHVLVVHVETRRHPTPLNITGVTSACILIAPQMAFVPAVQGGHHHRSVRPKRASSSQSGFLVARGCGTMPCACSCGVLLVVSTTWAIGPTHTPHNSLIEESNAFLCLKFMGWDVGVVLDRNEGCNGNDAQWHQKNIQGSLEYSKNKQQHADSMRA